MVLERMREEALATVRERQARQSKDELEREREREGGREGEEEREERVRGGEGRRGRGGRGGEGERARGREMGERDGRSRKGFGLRRTGDVRDLDGSVFVQEGITKRIYQPDGEKPCGSEMR